MLKFVFSVVMAGLLAGVALAGDDAKKPDPAADRIAPGGINQGAYSYAKHDRIMTCLKLTDEQITKIDALYKDMITAQQEVYKGLRNGNGAQGSGAAGSPDANKEAQKAMQEKIEAIRKAFETKVADVLTAEQKAKYEGALKIMADSQKAMQELSSKTNFVKMTADERKAYSEAAQKIGKEREEALSKLLGEAFKTERYGNLKSSQ